jgi:hypothetical protein
MRRLLELRRQIRELKKKFAPPPSPADSSQALIADLLSTWILIVLFHSHGWQHSSDGLAEIVRLLGIHESVEWNWNVPGVKDAVCELCYERILMKLSALVEGRGGKRPDHETMDFFNDEIVSLYSEIPIELKNKHRLPGGFLELYSRAEALFEQRRVFQGHYS